eukprot:4771158-Amphidinium_carterae.1
MAAAWRRGDFEYTNLLFSELGSPSFGALIQPENISAVLSPAYTELASARIRILVRTSRRALRYDRKHWFEDVCAAVGNGSGPEYLRKLHAAVRLLSRSNTHRGRTLATDNGEVIRSAADVQSLWHAYWGQHFNASAVATHNFGDRITMTGTALCSDPCGEQALVLDAAEVTGVLRRMPVKRATADAVPAAAYTAIASKLGPALCALFNMCIQQGQVPIAYAGARVVPVWKRKGSALKRASYRPISLLTLEAKLLAKMCLLKLAARLSYHKAQFGTGHRSGIEYPQVTVIQVAAWALAEKVPSATLFVDVQAAFDSVAHPILWGLGAHCSDATEAVSAAGYAMDQANALAAFLHTHPALLAKIGMPPTIVELLRQWGSSTWLVASAESTSAWRPHTGVPQGHNFPEVPGSLNLSSELKCLWR